MADISFYHLTKTPLEKALPALLEKMLASGKRGLVLVETEERLRLLDNLLWTYSSNKFLPHGTEKDGKAERQPVFLTLREENPNQAQVLVVTDGRKPAFAENFGRVVDIFDGSNETQLSAARARWQEYKKTGGKLTYFKQNDQGGWEEAA
jgi:DNA polymerase-3 subunit chi